MEFCCMSLTPLSLLGLFSCKESGSLWSFDEAESILSLNRRAGYAVLDLNYNWSKPIARAFSTASASLKRFRCTSHTPLSLLRVFASWSVWVGDCGSRRFWIFVARRPYPGPCFFMNATIDRWVQLDVLPLQTSMFWASVCWLSRLLFKSRLIVRTFLEGQPSVDIFVYHSSYFTENLLDQGLVVGGFSGMAALHTSQSELCWLIWWKFTLRTGRPAAPFKKQFTLFYN